MGGRIQNLGSAGRTFNNANNVEVPKLPNNSWGINRGIANHGFMHDDTAIWKEYIVPAIK